MGDPLALRDHADIRVDALLLPLVLAVGLVEGRRLEGWLLDWVEVKRLVVECCRLIIEVVKLIRLILLKSILIELILGRFE